MKAYLENDIIKSLSLHVGLVVFFLIYSSNFSLFNSDKDLIVVKSAVKVDLVGMPKHTLKELKALNKSAKELKEIEAAKSAPKVEVAKESGSEADEGDFLNKIKTLAKKKQPNKKVKKNNKKTKTKANNNFSKLILEGNKISKGSAITGDTLEEDLDAFSRYVTQLPDIVRSNWSIPAYLKDEGLSCKIRIYINRSGEVIKKTVMESSSDADFDDSALRAIDLSTPFPAPPEEIVDLLVAGKVVLAFPL